MTKKIDEIIRLFFTNIPGFRTTAYINDIIVVTSIKPKTFTVGSVGPNAK